MKKILLVILMTLLSTGVQAEVFKRGSYIIDMGVQPQTYKNGLLPYGMVYDMVINKEVPLYWIIKPGKHLFDTDFTYNGKDYKAGSLVLPSIYVTPAVEDAIANWKSKGVVIDGPTTSDFEAPAFNYISSFPNAVLDDQNHGLTEGLFYDHTDIPAAYWATGTPDSITVCSDVYALPHADPQDWTASEIAKYTAYTDSKAKSFLWQGCHSVGAVEAHSPYLELNILTTNGQIAWKNDPNYTLDNKNSPPYNYNTDVGDQPIMQIASYLDDQGGAGGVPTVGLNITQDVIIHIKDKKGFIIKDNFPDINITTHVIIHAEEFKLGKNITINVLPGGHLEIHYKKYTLDSGSSINLIGSGQLSKTPDGVKSGSGTDGDIKKITTALTINSDKQYNKFELEDNSAGGGGAVSTALGDGSQKIYIPRPDSAWRSTTTVAIWDPDNVNLSLNGGNSNKAALIAFGRAYGDPQNGILVQHASHTAKTGTESENVASARIYGNLLLQASIEKRPIVSINAPNHLYYPNSYEMTATVARGTAPFDFAWEIHCDGNDSVGIFSPSSQQNVSESNVTFTPANVTLGNCILRVKVTDHCGRKNFDTKILGITGYHPPLGFYNVTHTGEDFSASGGKDILDTAHPVNSLYTQISNKPFNVDVIALDTDKETLLPKDGNIILELIDTRGITDLDPSSCAKASIFSDQTSKISLQVANGGHFSKNAFAHATNISYPNAVQEVGFRVSYFDLPLANDTDRYSYGIPNSMTKADLDNQFPNCSSICTDNPNNWDCYHCIAKSAIKGGYGKSVCSRDNFSIRPDSFTLSLSGTSPLIGGKVYPFDIRAITYGGSDDILYTEPSSGTDTLFKVGNTGFIDANLTIPAGCTIDPSTSSEPWQGSSIQFIQGVGKKLDGSALSYLYNNIGDINITAYETTWSAIDMDKIPLSNSPAYDDCIKNSGSNTPVNGKIGCNVTGSYLASFYPSAFKSDLSIQDFKLNKFTYIADREADKSSKMYAKLTLTSKAVLDDGTTTATNYTAGCYAKDINYTISFKEPTPPISLSWGTALNRIRFATDGNTTTSLLADGTGSKLGSADFHSSESTFLNGTTQQNLRVNLQRDKQKTDNPFHILNKDFNLTITDGDTSGNGFNFTSEQNATFIYGRARPTRYFYPNITSGSVQTPILTQAYCDKWPASVANCPGIDVVAYTRERRWFMVTTHNMVNNDGNITLSATNGTVSPAVVSINTADNGIDDSVTVRCTAGNTVDINFDTTNPTDTNTWLIYNKDANSTPIPFYRVQCIGTSGWTGEGKTGHVVGDDINNKQSKRLGW